MVISPSPRAIELAILLRDFFSAADERALASAFARLCDEAAPDGLEYEFNALFTGPAPPLAPPWASVYLDDKPLLMGQSTLRVRDLYKAMGLAAPAGQPDDFIAFEIEAWLELTQMEDEGAQAARQWLEGHMRSWLPLFLAKMRGAALSPGMAKVAQQLETWLNVISGNWDQDHAGRDE